MCKTSVRYKILLLFGENNLLFIFVMNVLVQLDSSKLAISTCFNYQ